MVQRYLIPRYEEGVQFVSVGSRQWFWVQDGGELHGTWICFREDLKPEAGNAVRTEDGKLHYFDSSDVVTVSKKKKRG
ncbi:MAG: hypothetical protein ABIJ23_04705 [Candidatus Magasanikbacteria bacterium]